MSEMFCGGSIALALKLFLVSAGPL